MLVDNIIERGAMRLQNLNSDEALEDVWSKGSSKYNFYYLYYTVALIPFHYYYYRVTYKYTTTDQSPTWCNLYMEGWYHLAVNIANNPVADTEYTSSNIKQPPILGGTTMEHSVILNGQKDAINGVTSYVKNVLCYDVTNLYNLLLANGDVTDVSTMKTWCDTNLDFVPGKQYLDISSLLPTNSSTIQLKNGVIIADQIVEPDGMRQYSVSTPLRDNCWFDKGWGITIYNSSQSDTVTFTRVSAAEQGSPFAHEHPYVLKIETNGETFIGAGGFVADHMSAANKVFIERFVAKIPTGYTVRANYNSQGDNPWVHFITSNVGTGKWEEYAILYRCGSTGNFSNGGHVYISGPDNTSVTWYLAYANNCDVTDHEELINYTVLPNKHAFKKGYAFTKEFDCINLLTNGDGSDQSSAMLPTGWSYDTEDVAGNAIASIVQPVDAVGNITFGDWMRIDPCCRYKFSMWVKCKGDTEQFLTALKFSPDKNYLFYHVGTIYVEGTKTTLTASLNAGDTQMTVASNANWVAHSYSTLGFRSSYYSSYNNYGLWGGYDQTGYISGTSGSNIVTFNKAYPGPSIPKGRYVVESFGGSNYPYPFLKNILPTDNTWKYLEAYFGENDEDPWDGRGESWLRIPADALYLKFCPNVYTNTGTVPIKYADIRITPVSRSNGRLENKIAFKHYT